MKNVLTGLAALALIAVAPAFAVPITYSFTGTTTYNLTGVIGEPVSGSLTFDPSTFQSTSTDETTYFTQYGLYHNPGVCPACVHQSDPPQARGAFAGGAGSSVAVGGGGIFDQGLASIYRNGVQNQYVVQGSSSDADFLSRGIVLTVSDSLGAASEIFSDPNGGLDLWQTINWMAQGANAYVVAYEFDGQSGTYTSYQEARFDSIVTRAVPEPDSLALAAVALLGVVGVASPRRAKRRWP
ncbi:MAG TPA: hypothetical protein VI032_20925 [Burkholderiaceae bacterium]